MAEHEKQAVNTAPADVEVGSAEDVEAVMKNMTVNPMSGFGRAFLPGWSGMGWLYSC